MRRMLNVRRADEARLCDGERAFAVILTGIVKHRGDQMAPLRAAKS